MDSDDFRVGNTMRFSWEWWRTRALEAAIALSVVYIVVQTATLMDERQRQEQRAQMEAVPASAWFVVNEIYVPDHEEGTNPPMIYEREVKRDFLGFWVVEVQRIDDDGFFRPICTGFGQNLYEVNKVLDPDIVKWAWFIGRPCAVPPGRYRLRGSYVMKRPGWPEKEVRKTSNVFTVLPTS